MFSFHKATLVAVLSGFSATAFALPLTEQLEQAARAALEKQSAGLVEPRFELTLASPRPAPPCGQPLSIEPLDTRTPARMRFVVRCPDEGGWRYEYVVRGRVTAMVVVAAEAVSPGQPLEDAQVTMERRDVSSIPDALGAPADAVGQASRRSLRAGEVLRAGQLAAPVLVKRGDQVAMVARQQGIEVSTAGEALDAGSRGAIVRVRNSASGQVVRMRVTAAGTVEPVDLALTR